MLLGGHNLSDEPAWQQELGEFWTRYRLMDPTHPIFAYPEKLNNTLPFLTHGDEGRGRNKQPLLTISFQGILSHYGSHRLNTSGRAGYHILCFFERINPVDLHVQPHAMGCKAQLLQSSIVLRLSFPVLCQE